MNATSIFNIEQGFKSVQASLEKQAQASVFLIKIKGQRLAFVSGDIPADMSVVEPVRIALAGEWALLVHAIDREKVDGVALRQEVLRASMSQEAMLYWLEAEDATELFEEADRVRQEYMGDEIHLRGLMEFSNVCGRDCVYCGIRRSNKKAKRYRMDVSEMFETAANAREIGYHSVVMQSGESCQYPLEDICTLVRRMKKDLGLAVTLSLGEKTRAEYAALKEAGADRYLIRFETSDQELFKRLKPDSVYEERMQCLQWLREFNFQVGSGIMVGLPGQSLQTIVNDIMLMSDLDLDMIGIGPFISNPVTPLENEPSGTLELTLRTLSLIRIITRNTHLPATTAMGSIDPLGRQKALQCGANVLMPNITPTKYRADYQLYPGKICITDQPSDCMTCIGGMIGYLGRSMASHPGHSLKHSFSL